MAAATGLCAGKIALVTGAGLGIGRATALAFAREGASVVAADRDPETARATADAIAASGGQSLAVAADVADEDAVAVMVAAALQRFGRLDCAFNNAGVGTAELGVTGKRTAEITRAAWDRTIAVNLTGVWLCMAREIAAMQDSGGGAIVNTASVGGLLGLPTAAAYTASKHGVIGLTKAAAAEYSGAGIRVNAVCPGYIETRMTEVAFQTRRAALTARTPLGRLGTPEDIAELVVWLCSDRAGFVTGAAYVADGGYTAA